MKPAYENPGKTKGTIFISGTNMVKRRSKIILLKKEKSPSVRILSGREIILRMGFTITNITERTVPPKRNVGIPPEILTPASTWESANREKE